MQSFLTPSNIMFAIGIVGIIFTVYNYFRNPQISADKNESIMSLKINNLQADFANLRDNHIHTLDVKTDGIIESVNSLTIQVTRLSTIIDERIPKNKNIV